MSKNENCFDGETTQAATKVIPKLQLKPLHFKKAKDLTLV